MRPKIPSGRRIAAVCILMAFFVFFAFDLVKLQLVEGEEYNAVISSVAEHTAPVAAARGEIVDCNGVPLVYYGQSYAVILDAAYFPSAKEQAQRNQILLALIRLFERRGIVWNDPLPLIFDATGAIAFRPDSDKEIAEMKSAALLNLNDYATAQNCLDAVIKMFDLAEFSPADARKIASVCYGLKKEGFSVSRPYTFAQDVPAEIISIVKENSDFYRGVDADIVPVRQYADGTLAPHILGRVAVIDAEEYAEKKDLGYQMDDLIGKSGLELAMEDTLRGTDGEKTIYTDPEGNNTSVITKPPQPGNTVVTTIDAGLQAVAVQSLADTLEHYADVNGNIVDSAGAVVVLDCNSGAVLACASYPTYDITTYAEDVAALNTAPGSPLWNRALLSTYATGSTMKPSVAIGALEEGIIDENFTVYCNGSYDFLGQHFKCEQQHKNAYVNVVAAIDESCNIFFYEVGQMLGIEKMNEYRTLLGFGAKTGVELGEAAGVLDSPEYRASLNQEWLPGFTVQSAIGQAGNLFTPIQLANYVATIANGGTRYKTHFVKSIKSYDYSRTIEETPVTVTCETGISAQTLNIVKRGMLAVGTTGYCADAFADLPVKVAAKTGTSQEYRMINNVSTKINNGFLIAFAPYEAPEIAIAAVGEGMVSGANIAPVIADVVDYYFGKNSTLSPVPETGKLIP